MLLFFPQMMDGLYILVDSQTVSNNRYRSIDVFHLMYFNLRPVLPRRKEFIQIDVIAYLIAAFKLNFFWMGWGSDAGKCVSNI